MEIVCTCQFCIWDHLRQHTWKPALWTPSRNDNHVLEWIRLQEMVSCHSIFIKAKVLSGRPILFCCLNWVDGFALNLRVTFSKSGALSVVLLARWGQIWPNLQQSLNWLILTISYYVSRLKYQAEPSWVQLCKSGISVWVYKWECLWFTFMKLVKVFNFWVCNLSCCIALHYQLTIMSVRPSVRPS